MGGVIQLLKKANDNMPDWIKILGTPVIHGALVNNPIFKKQYRELMIWDQLSREEKEQRLFADVKKALIYAYEGSDYYRESFDSVRFNPYKMENIEDIKRLPILKKRDLIDNLDRIQVNKCEDFYVTSTGGTTGEPVSIKLDKDSIYKEKAFIYHFWSRLGYDYKKSRTATFRGLEFNGKYKKYNPLYNEIQLNPFLLNADTIDRYVDNINKFEAEFIHGYPSAIYSFCQLLENSNKKLKKSIKGVFFISENVYPFQREQVEHVLHCKTLSFYGNSERSVFAEQNDDDSYTFHSLYSFSEVLEDKRVICTGFLNRKMPLVRYDTDDSAKQTENGYLIRSHRGHDYLIGKHMETISAAAINFHSEAMDHVLAYQFVQNEIGNVRLNIVAKKGKKLDIEAVEKTVQKKVGQALSIHACEVGQIELSPKGKYRLIIQNIPIKGENQNDGLGK